jgi:hypothetical protein
MTRRRTIAVALSAVFAWVPSAGPGAAEFSSKGEVQLEGRAFRRDPDPLTKDWGFSQASRLQVSLEHGAAYLRGRVLGRADIHDDSRGLVLIEEAYAGFSAGDFSLHGGAKILNWSTTEAFHPADIINARNFDSNLENAEKTGEPMLQLNWLVGSGALNLYYMPYAMVPRVPALSNRLSLVPPGSPPLGSPVFIKRDGAIAKDEWIPQGAARLEQSFAGLDLALFWVAHQTRDQVLFGFDSGSGELRPVFMALNVYGLSTQQVVGPLLVKSEWAYRETPHAHQGGPYGDFDIPNHGQAAMGTEYTWYHPSGKESTFIVEGQAVLGIPTRQQRNSLGFFQRDMLLAWRLAFNDVNSKALFASFLFDLENDEEYLANISYEQRLSDVWGFKTAARLIHSPPDGPQPEGLQALDQDHNLTVTLTRYF